MAIFSIRNFAIKQLMKKGDDGIMKMPSQMKADFAEAMLTKQLIDAGIDPRLIKNEQQLVNVLDGIDDMKKKMAEMATKEKTGITSAKVFDLKGKKIKDTDNIMGGEEMPPPGSRGGKDDIAAPVQSAEETIKNMIEAENKKNIAKMKQRKMLNDAIEDASPGFANDIKVDAELVAENLAERMGLVYDDLPTKQRLDIYDQAYTGLSKQRFKGMKKPKDDPEEKAEGGRIGLRIGSDEGKDVSGREYAADTAASRSVKTSPSRNTGGGGNTNNKPPQKIKIPGPVKSGIDTFNNLNYLKNIYKLNPKGIMLDIGKQFLINKLFSEAETENLNTILGDGSATDIKNTMLADVSAMDIKRKNQFENLDYGTAKDIGMINPTMTEQEFEGVKSGEITEPTGQFIGAKGGRVGLKDGMNRRTFLKLMGGLASIPILGKFFKGAKVASKAAPVAMESATRSEAPTYFLKLVDKITKQGKPVTSTEDIMETYIYTAKNGDSYELVNDLKTGDLRITKDKTGIGTYGDKSFDTIEDRTVMEYKAPRQDVDVETGKGTREAPEYEEYKVEFDQDGTEAGAEAVEEYVQKEIIEESAEEAPSIKKADGGRVGLLKGGGILRAILTNLAKDKGISPSEYLRLTNYKSLPNEAKRIMSKDEFLKLKADMTEKRIELMDTVKNMITTRQNFEKSKANLAAGMNQASPGYGDKAVEMMFPPGSFKSPVPAGSTKDDVMMMEQLIKNLKTKDRQLNASGGVAYMLGE
jgi:hypothetical protein